MTKIEKFVAAKADAEAIKADLKDGVLSAVSPGAHADGSGEIPLTVAFSFPVTANLARCLVKGIEQNMPAILASAVAAAEAKRDQAKAAARAEAQEVLAEVGP